VDVSPAVEDFAQQGYALTGGRIDFVDNRRAAVLVYRHGAHIINVFVWAAGVESLPMNTTRKGYHVDCWREADLAYCAVSDTSPEELGALVDLLKRS
jgi:anti-sigma factor RsiW